MHPLQNPPRVSFYHLIRQIAPIMKVNRPDFDIRVEGVFVEEHRASSVVGHVEPICQNIMVDILNCFLKCDDVPLACDLFLKSTFFSTSRFWIPVVDAESLFAQVNDKARCCRSGTPKKMYRVSLWMPREILQRPFEHQPYVVLK